MRLQRTSRRPGAITVIVVAFLSLLLIMGLTFAFYGLREAEESRVYRDSQNGGQTGVTPTNRGSSTPDQPPEPDTIIQTALSSMIYGPPDDVTGAFNVLRQHEMARSEYGWNPKFPSPYYPFNDGYATVPAAVWASLASRAATTPFNGIGRVSPGVVWANSGNPNPAPSNLINYTWITDPNLLAITQGKMYDIDSNYARIPILPNSNPIPFTYNPATNPATAGANDRYWAKNADYTYPDENNLFLAVIDPKTGKVLIPSYHRPWLLNNQPPPQTTPGQPIQYQVDPATGLATDQTSPWWNAQGRFQMLRPRPIDNQWPPKSGISEWRYPTLNPDGTYGDVELLEGKASGPQLDAMWMDLDLPVGYWRGKAYKPMVAYLIVDLDGRINLNTAGNYYVVPGSNPPVIQHGSDQGAGPWEVNTSKVLKIYPDPMNPFNPVPVPGDGAQLLVGTGTNGAHARYGYSWRNGQQIFAPIKQYGSHAGEFVGVYSPQVNGSNMPAPGTPAHFYSGVDWLAHFGVGMFSSNDPNGHATNVTWGPGFVGLPGNPNNPPRPSGLSDPSGPSRFDDGMYVTDSSGNILYDERSDHPVMYNPYLLRSTPWQNVSLPSPSVVPNRTFGVEELRYLNAKYNYDDYTNSQLAKLTGTMVPLFGSAGRTLGNPAFRAGQLNSRFVTTPLSTDFDLLGASPWQSAPITYTYQPQAGAPPSQPVTLANSPAISTLTPANGLGDYDDSFRSKVPNVLGSIDLNRKLTDYRLVTSCPLGYDLGGMIGPNVGNVQRAIADRQLLAHDIFFRFCVAMGIMTPNNFAPSAIDPTQGWLAQLAVNIVDFIDNDDCITYFHWTDPLGGGALPSNDATDQGTLTTYATQVQTQGWVFGFERPRVTVNEAYVRIENDPTDPFPKDMATGKKKASLDYNLMMWLELHNPLTPATPGEQLVGSEGYPIPGIPDDNIHGGYRARLADKVQGGGTSSIYRGLLYQIKSAAGNNDPMGMLAPNNIAGLPTLGGNVSQLKDQTGNVQVLKFDRGGSPSVVDVQTPPGTVIQPNMGSLYQDQSFYLTGPQVDQQNGAGAAQIPSSSGGVTKAALTSSALQAKVKLGQDFVAPVAGGQPTMQWSPSVVLQRLACPALPPSTMNPWITTDYWESDPSAVNVRLKYDDQGNTYNAMSPGTEPDWNTTYSWGRRQPYDGIVLYNQPNSYRQQPNGVPQAGINDTFGEHNGRTHAWPAAGPNTDQNLETPFRPLTHYDRNILNPTELFHTVAVRPHQLTRQFFGPPGSNGLDGYGRVKYTADWLDHGAAAGGGPKSFLYRSLALLRTGTAIDGLGMGGRVPGKVNINTIFTQEVFDAICDAAGPGGPNRFQQSPNGTPGTVDNAFAQMLAGRNLIPGQFSQGDHPFRGYATTIGSIDGVNVDQGQTLARPEMFYTKSVPETWDPKAAGGHAAGVEKYEMMSKVHNQFTTRSNCFAVYMMVGYFEVKNPGPYNELNRPILGKELGVDDGSVTRNKYFAVVDRTNLTIEQPSTLVAPPSAAQPIPQYPPVKQGQPPVFFSFQPNVSLPQGPAYALIPYGSAGATEDPQTLVIPPPAGGVPIQFKVPAIGTDSLGGVVGQYDGTTWTLRTGLSKLVLDTGDRQEGSDSNPIVVTGVSYDAGTNSAIISVLLSGTKQHDRGCIVRLVNPDPAQPASTPGNPGPQPGFNFKSQRYAPVIKYVEQLR